MSEKGPIYGVELIDVLPLNYGQEGGFGMTQAMPSCSNLAGVQRYRQGERVVAGYEVLLNQWRGQQAELAELRTEVNAHRAKARDEYWAWQGDGTDFPESLTCPVLISASDLRGVLAENEQADLSNELWEAAAEWAGTIKQRGSICVVDSAEWDAAFKNLSAVCNRVAKAEHVMSQAKESEDI